MMIGDDRRPVAPIEAASALVQRLESAARTLELAAPAPAADHALHAANLLDVLIERLCRDARSDEFWLTYVALSSVFPGEDTLRAGLRVLELSRDNPDAVRAWLLETCLHAARALGNPGLEMDVVSGVVVDVSFSAQNEHNTGIQRVVRNTVPRWAAAHAITLVAWLPRDSAMRTLGSKERARVLSWSDPDRQGGPDEAFAPRIVVPWHSVIVLSEVPASPFVADVMTALGHLSGNRLAAIGYDAIPAVSADMVPWDMADHFARYLTIVKSMWRLAGISNSATTEFQGFVDMLGAQGLSGPTVFEVELPAEVPARNVHIARDRDKPLVLVVGSKEPRKNHDAVLYASERLWREGIDFDLEFIGTYGWDTRQFRLWLDRLNAARRPIRAPRRVGDAALWNAYERAAFVIFPSLHEGYGLPVAEALAHGTPVITSDHGSTAEIARDGGCILIDPRDDEQIVDAMRRLLLDGELRTRLASEAMARPVRSWQEYSDELWAAFTGGSV
jgi:glycosyltransferase involved in cell wall biosynthesis